MGYRPRFDAKGAVQHVWACGTGPSDIYLDLEDRRTFVAIAAASFDRAGVECLMVCQMTTHYHLVLRTGEPQLSKAMQRINGLYARSFNQRHGRRGHLFGERFGSNFVQEDAQLLTTLRYVALNPLDIAHIRHPGEWPWSSYANTVAGRADPLADTHALLDLVGGAERLRAFVERDPVGVAA